ncbi:CBN-SRD-16 protein [Aphelenchoides avenae]|nr:CBN-SRD-16 protein [Aphelenchus avenae]
MGVAVPTWVLHTPREMKPVVFSVLPNNNWPLVKAHLPFVFGAHITDPQMLAMVIYCSLHIGGGYAMICWCEYRIFKFLQQADSEVYKQTRKMHAEVHRALLALAISPLIAVVMPCSFLLVCEALGASPGLFTVFITGFATSVTLINPLTTVIFVRPYRRAVQKMFCSGKLISPSQMWSGSGRTVLHVRRGTVSNLQYS